MPDLSEELRSGAPGLLVCGVDEAGRGPLAGPVVAAAVILDHARVPDGLDDSKKLTARRRAALHDEILSVATVGICSAPPAIIDRLNIRGATHWAMAQAVSSLCVTPDVVLIDGRDVPAALKCPGHALVKGDSRSLSIAAASIVAKVTRDRMCAHLEVAAPGYGIAGHKGYPSEAHRRAVAAMGPSRFHRLSFRPVAEAAEKHGFTDG